MAAEQAKDRGNRAFSAGNFRDAVSSFTEAIALHERATAAGDADASSKLHVYYSNRSASQLKLGDGTSALQDADKCISIKRDWAKGYSRRGAALYQLGRFPDAFRAYKDGLAIEPANAALQEGLQAVQTRMAAASSSMPPPSTSSSSPSASSARGKTLAQFVMGDKAAMFQSAQFALRSLLLTTFVSYWLPLVLPSHLAFSLFFKIALFNYASYLMFTHGVPKWQAAYGQRLVLDPTTQSFFYCLVFWVSAPYGLAMVPVFLPEMVHFFAYLSNLLLVLGLANSSLVTTVTNKVLIPLTAKILAEPGFATRTSSSKWAQLYHRMPQVVANLEVAIGIAITVELLMPSRNFLLVMLYWQLLRVRYMISPPLQEAFRHLNMSILSLTSHPKCPAMVAQAYNKLRTFAASMVDAAQQQQQANSARSRCNIM